MPQSKSAKSDGKAIRSQGSLTKGKTSPKAVPTAKVQSKAASKPASKSALKAKPASKPALKPAAKVSLKTSAKVSPKTAKVSPKTAQISTRAAAKAAPKTPPKGALTKAAPHKLKQAPQAAKASQAGKSSAKSAPVSAKSLKNKPSAPAKTHPVVSAKKTTATPAKSSASKPTPKGKPAAAKVEPAKSTPSAKTPAAKTPVKAAATPKGKALTPAKLKAQREAEAAAALADTPLVKKVKREPTDPWVIQQRDKIYQLRDSILESMHGVAKDTLRSRAEGSEASAFGMHQADAGSDAYDRDFALSLLSQEQDALYEIEEALERIDYGTYGVCEMSGKQISQARLEALPFARYTVECQAEVERQKKLHKARLPVTSLFGLTDEEAAESEDEEQPLDSKE